MRNFKLLAVLALTVLLASPAFAGKFTVGGTGKGQFTDLKIVGATASDVTGNEATIDVTTIQQADTTGAVVVLTLDQDDTSEPFIDFEGGTSTASSGISISTTVTTSGSKVGAIQVNINGVERYIRFYDAAN